MYPQPKYNLAKRAELRAWIVSTGTLINRLKDQRKLPKNRRFKDFEPPPEARLTALQWEFRHTHIACSMMRGKPFSAIETLPISTRKWKARVAPDMAIVRNILKSCENKPELVTA